jgi:hypothetical protein
LLQGAKVIAVELQEVKGVQHGLADGAATVKSIEDGDAVWTADHGLAIDRERRAAESGRRAGDRWIARRGRCSILHRRRGARERSTGARGNGVIAASNMELPRVELIALP